jgi:hypothetical protein
MFFNSYFMRFSSSSLAAPGPARVGMLPNADHREKSCRSLPGLDAALDTRHKNACAHANDERTGSVRGRDENRGVRPDPRARSVREARVSGGR